METGPRPPGATQPERDERPAAFGDHEVVRLIGRGGMGAVFEGRSRVTGAPCAIKTVLLAGDALARDRFRREGELVARCDRHPGIVKVHSLEEAPNGTLYMILELVRGESLEKLLEREPRLEPVRAAKLALDLARALAFVHERGIVHRDVKPANVLLDADAGGAPRLTDFGLAAARNLDRLTEPGFFVGTLFYCAPEQAMGKVVGPPADVFSLGCVLFHMLAGGPPLEATQPAAILMRLCSRDPLPRVRLARPDVPHALEAIVARALEKRVEDRYPTALELAADLASWLEGKAPAPRKPSPSKSGARALAVLVGALATGLVAALVALGARQLVRGRAADEARQETGLAAVALDRLVHASPPASAEGGRLLTVAREHADHALEALERAHRVDPALDTQAREVARDVSIAEASALLGTGHADLALARLDALAKESLARDGSPLPAAGRLQRGRTLLALGRPDEAAREAEAIGAGSGDALELLGEAQLAAKAPAAARASFTRAIALAPTPARAKELKLRRGSAAALAGDDEAAIADLLAVAPELPPSPSAVVPEQRAATAGFAPIALALYRRGLAASDLPRARARDLETAWRIAAPPPELAADVAKVWAQALGHTARIGADSLHSDFTPDELDGLAAHVTLLRRALTVDPAVDMDEAREELSWLRLSVDKSDDHGPAGVLAARLLPLWPECAELVYFAARATLGHTLEDLRRRFELLCKAANLLPAYRDDHERTDSIPELARSIVSQSRKFASELTPTEEELAPIGRAARRSRQGLCQLDYERLVRVARRRTLAGEVLDGTALRVLSRSAGKLTPEARDRTWGGRPALAWREAGRGDALVLALTAPATGPRRLALGFDEGESAPIVRVLLNGTVLVPEHDLCASCGAWPAEEIVVMADLVAGTNELRIEVLGRSGPGANLVLSLDYVRFPE